MIHSLEQPVTLEHGQDGQAVIAYAINDTIVALEDLANIRSPKLRHDTSGQGGIRGMPGTLSEFGDPGFGCLWVVLGNIPVISP